MKISENLREYRRLMSECEKLTEEALSRGSLNSGEGQYYVNKLLHMPLNFIDGIRAQGFKNYDPLIHVMALRFGKNITKVSELIGRIAA